MKTATSRTPMVRRRSDNSFDKTGLNSQEEPLQVSTGRRRVNKGDEDRKSNEDTTLTCYKAEDSVCYESGDCVYIDSQRPDVAYFVCSIKEFRLSKRDSTQVAVRWYYRPSEVPESVYQLLVQDRSAENGSKDNILENESVKERELFISDATDIYPVSALRGKCYVHSFAEVSGHVKEYISRPDSFFYVLGYNPETRRLANTKGEIRVGPSHQAVLPECCPGMTASESPREQLTWNPQLDEHALMAYLRAARSMAQYAGMCNGGTPEDGFSVISQDATTINCLDVLHENDYDATKALQALVKKPYPKELKTKWTDDDTKKFVKGLRQHGKNFYKIRKELLAHKETMELVEYYYIWKKSQSALTSRPHRRRRHNVLRRKVYPRTNKNMASEFVDLSSCSEDDYESDDSEKDLSLYCCRHCFNVTSRSWHHGGQNKVILCTECRIFYKKYGRLPAIEDGIKPPPFMFKVDVEREPRDEDSYSLCGKVGLRSRRNNGVVQSTLRSGRNKTASPTEALLSRESPVSSRRMTKGIKPTSPSSGSTSSTSSSSMLGKEKHKKGKPKKGLAIKRSRDQSPDRQSTGKRKKNQESDEEVNGDTSDASSTTGGRDSVQPDNGDASSVCSSNNEDASSNRSSSPLVTRSEGTASDTLPAIMKRVLIEEGRSCARTDAVFIGVERPKVKSPCAPRSSDTAVVKELPEKTEAKDTSADRHTRPGSRHGPSDTPASVTSHYESAIRNMLSSSGEYYMYPPNIPMVGSSLPFGGFPAQPSVMDYGMMPVRLLPGGGAVTGPADMRESAAKYTEGFEQWYAPYRSQNSAQPLTAMSYLHKREVEQRNHEALVKGSGGLVTDPLTGMCGYLPQHHHSHQHTHFHIHPHDQHMRALQAQNLSAYEAYQQHPGLWRNYPMLWQQHPELMHSHGNSSQQRSLLSAEDHAPGHIHGLGSTPLDRQLQQQLLLNQQSKHRHPYMIHDEYMRQLRQHELEMKQRMEEAQMNDSYASGMFRKESRSVQSPSQLENVVKKSMDSSGAYNSPQKKAPVTIDLSDD